MNRELKSCLEEILGKIREIEPVVEGDISSCFRLATATQQFFVKTSSTKNALDRFIAEKSSLECISLTGVIDTPVVHLVHQCDSFGFIVMDFVESRIPDIKDFQQLGIKLAWMHQCRRSYFGWEQSNFIGSLEQTNLPMENWADFYAHQRLQPQIILAQHNGLLVGEDIPAPDLLLEKCQHFLAAAFPSVLHGDLWRGNFLISKDRKPYLIDPAVYFGHHQVDMAMTSLFGGFDPVFYKSYYLENRLNEITEQELAIYQLYYLLVHLNLFGRSYYQPVKEILKKYFC